MRTVRIGGGQGFWGDINDAAVDMVLNGDLNYLACDYLAELTLSILQRQRQKKPEMGYAHDFIGLSKLVLSECINRNIKIISNAGGMNVKGAVEALAEVARAQGSKCRIAAITGDDLLDRLVDLQAQGIPLTNMDTGESLTEEIRAKIVNANVYFGHQPIRNALAEKADVVIAGRCSDPSMFLGPLSHEFNWSADDWDNLARGIVVGHLLECGGQGSGGNFDYGWRDVPDLDNLGYPIAEVTETGIAITKTQTSGGLICPQSVKEQLIYEVHDPSAYITPDVVADFSHIRLQQAGDNRVDVTGVKGRAAPDTLKLCLGYSAGWRIVAYLPYAWPDAIDKARKTEEILRARLAKKKLKVRDIHFDLLGVNALHLNTAHALTEEPNEVVLRVAIRTDERSEALKLAPEIAPFNLNGPPGNCFFGGRPQPQEIIALWPTLVPRDAVNIEVSIKEVM
ncbi:ABC transporter substrate-binding protein [Betaproteobacteria bacterium]|nr:ABC transporter substrate-binding protein [Betaproteobacteria bacterium]